MSSWITRLTNVWLSLWTYLAGTTPHQSAHLNPWTLDRPNKIQFLEDCWQLTYPAETPR